MALFVFCPKRHVYLRLRQRSPLNDANCCFLLSTHTIYVFTIFRVDIYLHFFLSAACDYYHCTVCAVWVCFLLLLKTYQMLCSKDYEWERRMAVAATTRRTHTQCEGHTQGRNVCGWRNSSDDERNDNDIMVLWHAIISNWADSWIAFAHFFASSSSSLRFRTCTKCIWRCLLFHSLYHWIVDGIWTIP